MSSLLGDSTSRGGDYGSMVDVTAAHYDSELGYVPSQDQEKHLQSSSSFFTPIRTHWFSACQLLAVAANEAQIWTSFFDDARSRYVLLQAGVFCLLTVLYVAMRWEHKRLQQRGYVELFVRVNRIIRFVYFAAAWGVCLVCLAFVYTADRAHTLALERTTFLNLVVTLHSLVQAVALLRYVWVCAEHNRLQLAPEAIGISALPPSLAATQSHESSPRSHNHPSQLIDKQHQYIRYLEDRVKSLSQELVTTREQVDDSVLGRSPMDVGQKMASKDQEIRALKAECDGLRGELTTLQHDFKDFQNVSSVVSREVEHGVEQIDRQKKLISQQTNEIARLLLLLDVQKETNMLARQTFENLEQNNE